MLTRAARSGRGPVRPRLTLYSREYCHLCHEMLEQLRDLARDCGFHLEVIDVDADPELGRRFNELVPLLMHGEREIARWRLDRGAFRAYMANIG